MNKFWEIFTNNYRWILSGIGVFGLSLAIRALLKRRSSRTQIQKIDRKSRGQIAGRDMYVIKNVKISDVKRYVADLRQLGRPSYARIYELPKTLKDILKLMLEKEAMTVEQIAFQLGITQKMTENILKVLLSRGILEEKNNLYYLSSSLPD